MSGVWVDQLRLNWRRPSPGAMGAWPPGTRLVALPSALVRVRDVGRGPRTVVLTPDAPVVLENYDRLVALLAPHARVVCFEFPGCGFSYPRFGFGFGLADYVEVLAGVMDALAIARATLAFTCVNALMAMAYARRHPERVERLALAQVAGIEEMHAFARRIDFRLAGIPVLRTPVLGQIFMMAKRDFAAHAWFRVALPKGFDVEAVWRVTRAVYRRGGQFCLASLMQGQAAIGPEDVAVDGCPASVAWGMADRTHFKTRKDSIHAHLPHADIHSLPDRGHCPDIEAPEAYCRFLLTG